MPIKGVTENEENIIKSVLEPYKDKYNFYYYGSRVKGNFRFLSDLDILVRGIEFANLSDINDIKDKFDKSNLPYVVNISDYHSLEEKFCKLIEADLVKIT